MRWVIGDIHGMVKPLEALIRAVEQHDKERQLMFVGDYVNRGPHSKEVIDLLLSLKEARELFSHCAMGHFSYHIELRDIGVLVPSRRSNVKYLIPDQNVF